MSTRTVRFADTFQRAVMAYPPMRSMEYLRRLRKHGVHNLGAQVASGREKEGGMRGD
jgi:hypothetical protein